MITLALGVLGGFVLGYLLGIWRGSRKELTRQRMQGMFER